jgi:hypothetical protein
MWVRRETRSGNDLAPVQVFHAVPSSPFSAPAELACPITDPVTKLLAPYWHLLLITLGSDSLGAQRFPRRTDREG